MIEILCIKKALAIEPKLIFYRVRIDSTGFFLETLKTGKKVPINATTIASANIMITEKIPKTNSVYWKDKAEDIIEFK